MFSGDFTDVLTYSPIGPVEPTGKHVEWEVIGTFRYDDDGRLAEEWVQTDYRSFLTKLGVTVTESAARCSYAGWSPTYTRRSGSLRWQDSGKDILRRMFSGVWGIPAGKTRGSVLRRQTICRSSL